MLKFTLLRMAQAIPVILAVITVTFFLVRAAPGGPFDSEKAVLPEVKKALEAQYRLDVHLSDRRLVFWPCFNLFVFVSFDRVGHVNDIKRWLLFEPRILVLVKR